MRRICLFLANSIKFNLQQNTGQFVLRKPLQLQPRQLQKTAVMSDFARSQTKGSQRNENRPTRNNGTFGSGRPDNHKKSGAAKSFEEGATRPQSKGSQRNETRPTRNNGNFGSDRHYKPKGPLPGAARSLEEAKQKYEYFWGGDSPFSQFHWAPFDVEGIHYKCAEQYMMYKKAEIFRDRETASEILKSDDPKHMKSLGRKVREFDEYVWNDNCERIVEEATEAKFSQNEILKEKLFATHPKILAEASPVDAIWGIGHEEDQKRAWDERSWRGKNRLGFILTKVRNRLMEKEGLIKPNSEVNGPYEKAKQKYEFFWQSKSPFSQWHQSYFKVDDTEYCCAEQYMMHKKAVLFNDEEIAAKILKAKDPEDHKALGRKVKDFDPEVWNERCQQIVEDGNMAKFSQNRDLKRSLYATSPKILVEASPLDVIWGIGLAEDNELAWDEKTWKGTNYLGYVLTRVRDRLMKEEGISNTTPSVETASSSKDKEQLHSVKKNTNSSAVGGRKKGTPAEIGKAETFDEAKQKYSFFWQKDSPFSPIHSCSFEVDGIKYNCLEQFLMHQKAVLFGDNETGEKILRKKDGKGAKSLGGKVKNVDEKVWLEKCHRFVEQGCREKFSQDEKLKETLLETYPRTFVFANPHDDFWGIGFEKDNENAWNEETWKGKNYLGQALTRVRDELKTGKGHLTS